MADELKEKLAELAHGQWSGWMDYMFSKCIPYQPDTVQAEDGALIIPKWAADRWKRQAKTPYLDLTPAEMDSDRTEADKFLKVFNARQPDTGLVDALQWIIDNGDCEAVCDDSCDCMTSPSLCSKKVATEALAKYTGE